jgi:hypothetical protein
MAWWRRSTQHRDPAMEAIAAHHHRFFEGHHTSVRPRPSREIQQPATGARDRRTTDVRPGGHTTSGPAARSGWVGHGSGPVARQMRNAEEESADGLAEDQDDDR